MNIDRKCLRSVLIFALEAGAVAALVLFPPLEAWVKSFSNVFMVGRSSVKVYLLVIGLLVARRIYVSKRTVSFDYSTVFLFGMFVLYLIGLWEYLAFCSPFFEKGAEFLSSAIDVFRPPLDFAGTMLTHSHNAKAILAYPLLSMGFAGHMKYFNAGAVFVGFYPAWLLILHGMIYIAFFISAILTLGWAKRFLSPQGYVVLTIAILVNLKCVVDGGVFDLEAWCFGIPVYLYCWLEARRKKDWQIRSWILGLAVVVVFYASYEWINLRWHFLPANKESNIGSLPFIYVGAAAMALFVNCLNELRQKRINPKKWLFLLLFILVFYLWRHALPANARENYAIQSNIAFSKGEELLLASGSEKDLARALQDGWFLPLQKGSLNGYALWCVRLEKDTRYYDLSRKIGVQPQCGPIARQIGSQCFDGQVYSARSDAWIFPCASARSVSLHQNFSLNIGPPRQQKNMFGRNYCLQEVESVLPLDAPMKEDAFLALLGRAGIRELIRINRIKGEDERPAAT